MWRLLRPVSHHVLQDKQLRKPGKGAKVRTFPAAPETAAVCAAISSNPGKDSRPALRGWAARMVPRACALPRSPLRFHRQADRQLQDPIELHRLPLKCARHAAVEAIKVGKIANLPFFVGFGREIRDVHRDLVSQAGSRWFDPMRPCHGSARRSNPSRGPAAPRRNAAGFARACSHG